jgi:hypothetical protein
VPYGVCVAWIRRVRTASGITGVQTAEPIGGRRIVSRAGSAHGEAELGLPVERECRLLDDPDQGELELEPASPRRAPTFPPAIDPGRQAILDAITIERPH